jgi:hypothetical protein
MWPLATASTGSASWRAIDASAIVAPTLSDQFGMTMA